MLRDVKGAIECPAASQFLEPLRASNKPAAPDLAYVECLDQELEQTRIRRQQLEQKAAESVLFDEAHELRERRIGIGCAAEPGEQEWSKLAKNLARPGGDRNA